jgi:hypothetical protein
MTNVSENAENDLKHRINVGFHKEQLVVLRLCIMNNVKV